MALTAAVRAQSGNNVSATTQAISPTSNFTPGTNALLMLGYDNAGTAGADPGVTSIVDNVGNTWTLRGSNVNTGGGVANNGCVIRFYTATIATLTTTDVITVTFPVALKPKGWILLELASDVAGNTAELTTVYNGGTGTTTGPSMTTAISVPVNELLICAIVVESFGVMQGDTDTLNGTWTTLNSGNAGEATTTNLNIRVGSQRKLQTTTPSTQVWNVIHGSPNHWAFLYTTYKENRPVPLDAHGDASTGASATMVVDRPLAGHADVATGATGDLTIARSKALDGHADVATGASGSLSVDRPLAAHADATTGGTGTLLRTVPFDGHADATSGAGTAMLARARPLDGHGDAATGATGSLDGGRALTAHADAATGASGVVTVGRGLGGHADVATGATGTLTVTAVAGVSLDGHGDVATGATGTLSVARSLAGHADAATEASAFPLARLRPLDGHADAATGATASMLGRLRPLDGHADAASGASAPMLERVRSFAGHADAASGATATRLTLTLAFAGHADVATGASGNLVMLGAAGGTIKVWNGTVWTDKPMKVWTGSAWVAKPVKVWNGSAWVLA